MTSKPASARKNFFMLIGVILDRVAAVGIMHLECSTWTT